MPLNFADCLFSELLRHPAREVLRWPATEAGAAAASVTAAGLLGRVVAWQRVLEATRPLPVGTPVLLAYPGSPEVVAALLAVLGLGAVPVLPPAGARPGQLWALVRRLGVRHAVLAPAVARRWGWLLGLLGVRAVAATSPAPAAYALAAGVAAPGLREVPAGQPALVSHSSGSVSGQPTAVRRSHRVLQAQHEALRRQFPPYPGQRDFPLFPNVILHNLAVGALSIVPELPGSRLTRLEPARVLRQLAAERVETLTGNVFYFEQLVAQAQRQAVTFPLVRALGVGGSPVPEQLLAALAGVFPQAGRYVIYGSSEAEPIAVRAVAGPAPDPRRGYCVGQPVPGLQVRLREPAPVWQPAGSPPALAGEIEVRGAHVALPLTAAPAAWLPTGDFGYLDPAGQLWLTGRRGAAPLVQGVGHYQLEHLLRHLPGVAQVAALPTPHGFRVFVAGPATTEAVQAAAAEGFGPGLLAAVHHRTQLPLDNRHHSKIRYDLVK